MCGIAGVVSAERPEAALVRRMCDEIIHRGPDGAGLHADDTCVMGMRRLAIIDVAGGQQPVRNEDGTVVAVFNGELYNFPELRTMLIRKGHRFVSEGDSECLVHLYEELGDDLVHRLRGMFAFAIWDSRRRRLLLGRDRVGKKPLYWWSNGSGISFASEAKSLLRDPSLPRRLDPVALHHYLTYQYVPAPWSIYQGVRKLPPGHLLTWTDGTVDVRPYWRLDCTPHPVPDETAAAGELRERLLDAVRVRMVSERPIGAFLSGGVDSSAVVAAMARQSTGPVKTFSIGFEESRYDERAHARLVADRYGTDHHELVVDPSCVALLPTLAWHFDEPFADSSAIPSFYVAQMSRQHVTVVLNGDGGDESFGGYRRYALMQALGRVPAWASPSALERIGTRLVQHTTSGSRMRAVGRILHLLGQSPLDRYCSMISAYPPAQQFGLYTDELREQVSGWDSWAVVAQAYESSRAADPLGRIIDADVNTYLPGDLLPKVDISTMANSLEARSPFLDHHLMEWAAHLPTRLKVRRGTTKYLLKRAVEPWLPAEIIHRPKMGFAVPMDRWLRGELRDMAWSLLTDATARSRGLFRPEAVTALLRRHEQGQNEGSRIWALLQFELWHRRWLDESAGGPAAEATPGIPVVPAQVGGGAGHEVNG
ncbi:asparagine synthase (glutamine-hydrolyzing) [Micromonospora sp. NBS 11-29]|uniref:asparagine synthase (glutamine-hydrolyzing) n=1 Tax=Micromonospora sp. NBS 11-29 TaxID=1960879 RepID=UPI001594C808|nr:asparagine synthase (glutamine-hydrolyzing) [Micromonospora sp. NBS 11-29]